jgi:hypothetical protein
MPQVWQLWKNYHKKKMWLNIGNAAIDMNVIARNVTFATEKDIQNMNTNQKWCKTDGSSLKQVCQILRR